MRRKQWLWFALGLAAGLSVRPLVTHAQAKDIPPYEFATFPVPMQLTEGHLYKVVHQGCELFIATTGKNSQSPTVAITTGRGCR